MKKYNSTSAIIIGWLVASVLAAFLPDVPYSDILALFILILGGFIATYISQTNKALFGLYEGVLYSVSCLPIILIFNKLTLFTVSFLILTPILGLIGGYIAKLLRLRMDDK